MARTIRCISRMNLSSLMSNVTRQLNFNGSRTIYTEESLGMTDYKRSREMFLMKYQNAMDSYRTKLTNIVGNDREPIFTEDMKVILHLVERKPEDIELMQRMLEKYNNQYNERRFNAFKFGPVVMRTLYYLNEPELAKTLFSDPKFNTFFDQLTSYMILLDLLYENGQYTEIRDTYDKIKPKFVDGPSHPKLAVNVVAMACYKENTMESLEYGLNMCNEISSLGSTPLRRVIALIGALALNQNKPEIALELVTLCRSRDYISMRCTRVMALADLDKIDDIVIEFNSSLTRGNPQKNQYYCDVIPKVEASIRRLNIDDSANICDLIRLLKEKGYIYDMSLSDHITRPIHTFKRTYNTNNFEGGQQEWSNNERDAINSKRFFRNRPNNDLSAQATRNNLG